MRGLKRNQSICTSVREASAMKKVGIENGVYNGAHTTQRQG